MNLNVQTDRTLVREAGKSARHVLLTFTAPDAARAATRPPLNVSFVIDRSGSMGGSKIQLAREAVIQALRMLRDTDRFSVIAYDNEIDVIVPSTHASAEAVRNGAARVKELEARGSTDLSGGWLKGCEQIAQHLDSEMTARCLLMSDGLANAGIQDRDELARHAKALAERGIRTSCLGIGDDYDERLLEGIASSSGGHAYHVEQPVQIADILTSELGEALEIVAKDVVIAVRPAPGMTVTTLNRFEVGTKSDGSLALRLGDLAARQEVALVFAIKFPSGPAKSTIAASFEVSDARDALNAPETDLLWTFADHAANDAQPRNREVDHAAALLYAAAARAEALEMNRAGRYADSSRRLKLTSDRIAEYAANDPVLGALVEELRDRDMADYSRPMSSGDMKRGLTASYSMSRMRDDSGKARRKQ